MIIQLISQALCKSLQSLLQFECQENLDFEAVPPKNKVLIAKCEISGHSKSCNFLLSFPQKLVNQIMHEIVDLHHQCEDYTNMMFSVISEIGNYTSAELAANANIKDNLGSVSISVPEVWSAQEREFSTPESFNQNLAVYVNGCIVGIFTSGITIKKALIEPTSALS